VVADVAQRVDGLRFGVVDVIDDLVLGDVAFRAAMPMVPQPDSNGTLNIPAIASPVTLLIAILLQLSSKTGFPLRLLPARPRKYSRSRALE